MSMEKTRKTGKVLFLDETGETVWFGDWDC